MIEFTVACIGSGFVGALLGAAGAALYVTRNFARPVQSGEPSTPHDITSKITR